MSKSLIILTATICLVSACSNKQNENSVSAKINQSEIDEQDSIEKSLSQKQFSFDGARSNYTTNLQIVEPCEKETSETVQNALSRTSTLLSKLGDEAKYTDDALKFYRKIAAAKESISSIVSEFQSYCAKDNSSISSCLTDSESVGLLLDYDKIEPALSFEIADKNIGSYVFTFSDSSPLSNVSRAADLSHFENISNVLSSEISLKKLKALSACLSQQSLVSQSGKLVLAIANGAVKDAEENCAKTNISIDRKACEP